MRRLVGLVLVLCALAGLLWLAKKQREPKISPLEPKEVRLYRHATRKVEVLPLEEYVVGVVAAEMPAEWPLEALKAQAVAARTYVLRRIVAGGVYNNPHPGADISDDPQSGQAYIDREELKRRLGLIDYYRYYPKIRRAVEETKGLVLVYRGQLIEPAYHACCGGHTEDAAEIWAVSAPYLKGVPCPCAEAEVVKETRAYALADFYRILLGEKALPALKERTPALAVTRRSSTGRPLEVAVAGVRLPAVLVRERLGLKSTRFTWEVKGERVEISTVGYGHGVGLCQRGAKVLAEKGYDFRRILSHYYTGVEIVKY
ncbi:stage II sporulation protein D [Ammonifex thiophilus]|uniref:Stage II sporulation protein D n=1 Tax=Ammonifex thiophilus TaxID=444093 RepID=A0A3D8P7V0_9THEO|nr:stage II sporulation protein D [Ammonifex thiophilus]RDV84509.1 stage II sporulation protein D [Ammonifex thiophilus]